MEVAEVSCKDKLSVKFYTATEVISVLFLNLQWNCTLSPLPNDQQDLLNFI